MMIDRMVIVASASGADHTKDHPIDIGRGLQILTKPAKANCQEERLFESVSQIINGEPEHFGQSRREN